MKLYEGRKVPSIGQWRIFGKTWEKLCNFDKSQLGFSRANEPFCGVIRNTSLAGQASMGGWSVKWAENLTTDKRLALDHLIANGFVEPTAELRDTKYHHTTKTELLFAQLCVGISGG